MEVKLLALGLFEKFNPTENAFRFNLIQIKNFYGEKVFHFNVNTSDNELDISPMGGFFSPAEVKTTFYKTKIDKNRYKFSSIITRQPAFFAFVLPYPTFQITNINTGYKSLKWLPSYDAFYKDTFQNLNIPKKISYFSFDSELAGIVNIRKDFAEDSLINNFFENNCHPIFVESHEELCILINDYKIFMKKILNIDIHLDSFSKIIIPFFELREQEKKQLSLTKSDLLPF